MRGLAGKAQQRPPASEAQILGAVEIAEWQRQSTYEPYKALLA